MKLITLTAVAALTLSSFTFAGADCPKHPKAEWLKEADAKAKIEGMGYKIKKFKVSGECYEIYGHNKEGKKAEVYFDTKTLNVVKAEID
ncbi:PepSY domain-containing protein [Chitinibacter sp. FCG-7]|uniref:PepSY domain-containing protein n=1 Tax=Chitinibacter mangrovi TaxID=3153927 RepID=A0AAU7FDS4_9NEIS